MPSVGSPGLELRTPAVQCPISHFSVQRDAHEAARTTSVQTQQQPFTQIQARTSERWGMGLVYDLFYYFTLSVTCITLVI